MNGPSFSRTHVVRRRSAGVSPRGLRGCGGRAPTSFERLRVSARRDPEIPDLIGGSTPAPPQPTDRNAGGPALRPAGFSRRKNRRKKAIHRTTVYPIWGRKGECPHFRLAFQAAEDGGAERGAEAGGLDNSFHPGAGHFREDLVGGGEGGVAMRDDHDHDLLVAGPA